MCYLSVQLIEVYRYYTTYCLYIRCVHLNGDKFMLVGFKWRGESYIVQEIKVDDGWTEISSELIPQGNSLAEKTGFYTVYWLWILMYID